MHVERAARPAIVSRRKLLRGAAGLVAASALLGSPLGALPVAGAAPPLAPGRARLQLSQPADGQPVVAETLIDGVQLRAYPKTDSDLRQTAAPAALLRVFGQAPGIDGDTHTWWATNQGFAEPLEALGPAAGPWAGAWTLPEPALAAAGWWGQTTSQARVRPAPTPNAPVVGILPAGQRVKVLAEEQGEPIEGDPAWVRIDGGRFAGGRVHASIVTRIDPPAPNTTPPDGLPDAPAWIVVDRATSTLTFVRAGNPELATYVALGRTAVDTPLGQYATIYKVLAEDMSSARNPGADRSYHLPAVPHIQYFHVDGYAVHGTYWHDDFGTQQSQGCVNLTLTDAAYLFSLTEPGLAAGQTALWSPDFATPLLILG